MKLISARKRTQGMSPKRRAGLAQERGVRWVLQDGNQRCGNAAATRTPGRRWRMSLLGESTQRPGHPRSKGALRGKVTAPRDSLRGLRGLPSPPSHGRDCAQWKLQPWHPANSNNSNQRGASQGGPAAEHSRRRLPWVPSSPPPPRKRPRSLPPARTPLAGPCPSGGPDQTALLGEAEDGGGGSSGSVVTT